MRDENDHPRQDQCAECINLIDNRYCLHWRDIVPTDTWVRECPGFVDKKKFPF